MKSIQKFIKYLKQDLFDEVDGPERTNFIAEIVEYHPAFSLTNREKSEIEEIFTNYFNEWCMDNLTNLKKDDKVIKMMEEFCDFVPTKYEPFFPQYCKIKNNMLVWELNNGLPAIKIKIS